MKLLDSHKKLLLSFLQEIEFSTKNVFMKFYLKSIVNHLKGTTSVIA